MVRSNFSSRAFFWLVCAAACGGFGGFGLDRAVAQVPSAEQIEIFQTLPPDQQQAILDSMNRGTNGPTNRPRADRQLQFPETVRPRTSREGEEEESEEDRVSGGIPRVPRLKGNDTVLLTLEIRQLERQAPEIEERERQEREQNRAQQLVVPTQPGIPGRQQATQPSGSGAQPEQQRRIERTSEDSVRLGELRERVLRRNPYKLDKWGILNVPELGPIPLAGLTAEEATERLAAEPRLQDFIVRDRKSVV